MQNFEEIGLEAQGTRGSLFDSVTFGGTPLDTPIEISVRDLCYWIEFALPSKGFSLNNIFRPSPSKKIRNQILFDVSITCRPGSLIALMGPSGSGKTTLLYILSRRVKRNLSGKLLYNGVRPEKGLKRKIGYVLQHDMLIPNLTVRETLTFTALLRLPNTLTYDQKLERVEEVIDHLHLKKCANSMLGDDFNRGVSGGEKKRACIATELIINPALCLLDEPTSGLDSSTSFSLIKTLKALSRSGRTVISSIHQPSSQMFSQFDQVLLLADGKAIYWGPPSEVVPYFTRLGHEFPHHYNPADWLLELVVEDADRKANLVAAYLEHRKEHEAEDEPSSPNVDYPEGPKFHTTWLQQAWTLALRNWKVQRIELMRKLQYFQILAFALVIGFFWLRLGTTEDDIYPRISAIWLSFSYFSVHPTMVGLQAMFADKFMLAKERAAGTYRLSSWYAARVVAEVPSDVLLPSLFLIIAYWMVGLPALAESFFTVWVCLILISMVQRAAGVSFICVVTDLHKAIVILSVFILAGIATSGFLIPPDKIPVWLQWFPYIFVPRYAFQVDLDLF